MIHANFTTGVYKKIPTNSKEVNQEAKIPELKSTNTETKDIDAKITQIINDFKNGTTTVEETINALKGLGIEVSCTENDGKTVITFEYQGKTYTIETVKDDESSQDSQQSESSIPNYHLPVGIPHKSGGRYTNKILNELIQKYNLTDYDCNLFFVDSGVKDINGKTTYMLNNNFIKNAFMGYKGNITNVEELITAIQTWGLSSKQLKQSYGFSDEQISKYFTVSSMSGQSNPFQQNNQRYVLNQDLLKQLFPGKNIQTPGQLKELLRSNQ